MPMTMHCGCGHQAVPSSVPSRSTLKKPCSICKGRYLQILHEVNSKPATETMYLDRPTGCRKVLLKVVRVQLRHRDKTLYTYAVLDDGSERTILLSPAATKLGIHGPKESPAYYPPGCKNFDWSRSEKRLTIGEYIKRFILKRQSDRRSARNTNSQSLFK